MPVSADKQTATELQPNCNINIHSSHTVILPLMQELKKKRVVTSGGWGRVPFYTVRFSPKTLAVKRRNRT